jgi:hypothetical protein
LQSDDDWLKLGAPLLDPTKCHFDDCAYWNPPIGPESEFPTESIQLDFDTATIDLVIDENCKPVIHIPTLAFLLAFDRERFHEEQVIEILEIYTNKEE